MFKKKENKRIKKELETIQKARESVEKSKKALDNMVKAYDDMQKGVINAIKDNHERLTLHSKVMLEVDGRLKSLEQKKVNDDVMFK